jgi:hypothetical protein
MNRIPLKLWQEIKCISFYSMGVVLGLLVEIFQKC